MTGRKALRIGVYVPMGVQLLDAASVDVLFMMGREYISGLVMLPKSVAAIAPEVTVHWIGVTPPGSKVPWTSQLSVEITKHISDPEVQPGQLDVVLVPGIDPAWTCSEEILGWLRAQMEHKGTDVLSVCTGIFMLGQAGLLRGRKASGPRGFQGEISKRFPGVELVGDSVRWVQDGDFWSSGGITNGTDMVAAYARQSPLIPPSVAELAIKMADVGDRPRVYTESKPVFFLGFLWQLLRASIASIGKSKEA